MSADSATREFNPSTVEVDVATNAESNDGASAADDTATPLFEVSFPSGERRTYSLANDLRHDILEGRIPRGIGARILVDGAAPASTDGGWTSVEELATRHPELRSAYRPIRDTALRFATWGAVAGVVLKLLDTTTVMVAIDDTVGITWLIVIGSLLLSSRWAFAPVIAILFSIKAGIGGGLFVAALASGIVGVAFGAPIGMVVGTVVGHFRRDRVATAPDARPEGVRPWVLGLALPLLYLGIAVPAYVWLNLKAVEWLAG